MASEGPARAAGGGAAVGAAGLAVVAGEELHDAVELGALLGEERRRRDGAGALDRGPEAFARLETLAQDLGVEEGVAFVERLAAGRIEDGIGAAVEAGGGRVNPGRRGGDGGITGLGETGDVDLAAPGVEADMAAAATLEKTAVGRRDPVLAALGISAGAALRGGRQASADSHCAANARSRRRAPPSPPSRCAAAAPAPCHRCRSCLVGT